MTRTNRTAAAFARAALPLLAAAGAAHAQPEVYFSEYQFQNAAISAMNPDGSNPHLLFNLPPALWLPLGLTFNPDTQRLIWMDSAGASEVLSAELDGSDMTVITPVSGFARGASLDAQGRIYFSTNNMLQRVDAGGSNLTTIFTSDLPDPLGNPRVDATNGHVYVGTEGRIYRMNLDGSNRLIAVRGVARAGAIGLDIARGSIYWTDTDTISDFVGRARLDDTEFTVLIDNSPNVVQSTGLIDVLVDPAGGVTGGAVFYADELLTQIFRAGLDGQGATPIYTSPAGRTPSGLTFSTGEPVQALQDCDGNGILDDLDIAAGAPDCDNNGVIDTCQDRACDRVFLLDQGTLPEENIARAVGIPSEWQVFQPFEVPGEGWSIDEIGLDGYTINYADGSGLTVRLFPDDGTGLRPDESIELASTMLNLRFSTITENWVYAPFNVTLDPGTYWVRIEANNPTVYGAGINHGFDGFFSLSRGSNGNFTNPAPPIALRLVQSQPCAADWNGDGAVNSDDYFAFLADFFSGDADFNDDAVTNSDDYFAFLAAFFEGCP